MAMPKKNLVAHVAYTFDLTSSFTEGEIQPDPEGDKDDFEPTVESLADLGRELKAYLQQVYDVGEVSVADCETLFCVDDED